MNVVLWKGRPLSEASLHDLVWGYGYAIRLADSRYLSPDIKQQQQDIATAILAEIAKRPDAAEKAS